MRGFSRLRVMLSLIGTTYADRGPNPSIISTPFPLKSMTLK